MATNAMKIGWIVGQKMRDILTTASNYPQDINSGLALAFKRYNYHMNKYTKKSWITCPVGMSYIIYEGQEAGI